MDSGNSGSLQSSSGGDEEYDSRAASDSISTFMTAAAGPISNPPTFFDPLSNYLHLHQHQNPLLNSAPAWPATRPDPNHLMMSSTFPTSSPNFMPSFHPPPPPPPRVDNSPTAAPPQNQTATAARGSKKRSRASRRAPTTVLTTDTTNFRAMVQEFTGIPSPPFNNSSFPRNRLDLFSTRSAAPPPPYLRRPFPHKPHPTTTTAAASSSYQLQLPNISQNSNQLLNSIPNPLLTSFLQSNSNPKFPLFSKMGGLDEQFGSGPDNLAGLQNLIHQNDGVGGHDINTNNASSRWNEGERRDDGAYKGTENVESWICSSE